MTNQLYYICYKREMQVGDYLKRIAAVNDISGFGRCSLTAALPVISALGIECCPLPTAVLSNQTGYDSFHCVDLTTELSKFLGEWKKLGTKFDGILTGYIASATQAELISTFIDEFATEDTVVVVDPVMADDGQVYGTYSRSLCTKVAQLAKKADIITPNLTELCILARHSYKDLIMQSSRSDYLETVEKIARTLLVGNVKCVIVTGVRSSSCICNILVEKDKVSVSKSEIFGGSYSGTGDIFSSIVCAHAVKGTSMVYAVESATRFLEKSIKDSYREGTDRNDGVNFQKYLEMLTNE